MRIHVALLLLLPALAGAATINTAGGTVTSYVPNAPAVAYQLTGTWTGALVFEGSNDKTTFVSLRGYPVAGGAYVTSTTSNGAWTVPTGGLLYVRVRASAWTSGTVTVSPAATTSPVVVDIVRAVGGGFDAVSVTGRVDAALTDESLAALGTKDCTYGEMLRLSVPAVTPIALPPNLPDGGSGALPGRTEALLVNIGKNQNVSCRVDQGDGGLPDCATPGYGATLLPNGGAIQVSAKDEQTLRCVACSGSSTVEIVEAICTAPR